MNQEEEFLKSIHRKRKRKFAIFAIILISFLLLPAVAVMINKIRLEYLLHQQIDEIRAKGYPINFEELRVWYGNGNKFPEPGEEPFVIRESENAVAKLNEAFNLMVDDVPNPENEEKQKELTKDEYEAWYNSKKDGTYIQSSDLIIVGYFNQKPFQITPLPPDILALNELYLKANEKAMLKFKEASKKPYCRFKGFCKNNFINPGLSRIRQGARLFAMKSNIAIENNRIDESIESIKNGIALSSLLNDQPYLITYLVKIACHGIAINNFSHLLSKKQLTENQLKKLADIFKNEPDGKDLKLALWTEIPFYFSKDWDKYVIQSYVNNLCFKDQTIASFFYPVGGKLIPFTGFTANVKIIQLDYLQQSVKETQYDYYESKERMEELTETVSEKLSSNIFWTSTNLTLQGRSRILANLRNTRTAIAVELYNLKYKKLPESLDKLVPEFLPSIPVDPFDGRPLKYVKKAIELEGQAVKMTPDDFKSLEDEKEGIDKSKPKKKKKGLDFGNIFGGPSSKVKYPDYNEPLPGYKLIDVKLPGYIIYSVGNDGKDNSGSSKRSMGSDYDISIQVTREGLNLD